jgi:hypothetical protein
VVYNLAMAFLANRKNRDLTMFVRSDSAALVVCAAFTLCLKLQADQAVVNLGAAANFAVLAGTAVTNTGPTTVNGDVGVWTGTSVSGFPPGEVVGSMHAGDTAAQLAQAALTVAYNDAAGRTVAPIAVAGNLGGQTLAPGLYKSTSTLAISSEDLTLDAQGNNNAVFIFQVASGLTVTSGRQVVLIGNAQAANVYWQVGSSATLGTNVAFNGNILAYASVTLDTGATLSGRALAQTGAVTMDSSAVAVPPAPPVSFFAGEMALGNGLYSLTFPDSTLFGTYSHTSSTVIDHVDLGVEFASSNNDSQGDVYLYDFQTGHWFYTGPSLFPYLYDFTLEAWLYYYPDTKRPGHYTTGPRYFYNFGTKLIITL